MRAEEEREGVERGEGERFGVQVRKYEVQVEVLRVSKERRMWWWCGGLGGGG